MIAKDIYQCPALIFQSYLELQRDYEQPSYGRCREGSWVSSGGPETRSMALPAPSPQHKTDFGFVLRYLRLQGTLQRTY